ncbi:MAG: hypothetical protein M1133_02450 [Armatimonadetes bacterium]|nr:hypothetical protein [Armatimonadota bacterium]
MVARKPHEIIEASCPDGRYESSAAIASPNPSDSRPTSSEMRSCQCATLHISMGVSVGYNPMSQKQLKDIDAKIANIRKAVEEGLPDHDWAISRMRELMTEREALAQHVEVTAKPPQIDVTTALAYRSNADKIMDMGTNAEKRRLIRSCVDKITIAPDTLEVEIQFKVTEAIGACSGSGGPLQLVKRKLELGLAGSCIRLPAGQSRSEGAFRCGEVRHTVTGGDEIH